MRKLKYLSICLLSTLALTACEDDPTVINPDPGRPSTAPDAIGAAKATLSSEYCPGSDIVLFNIGDPYNEDRDPLDTGRGDRLKITLPAPLDHDITLRIGMDPEYAELTDGGASASLVSTNFKKKYNIETEFLDFNGQPLTSHLNFLGDTETFVTIKAGETESPTIDLHITRDNLNSGVSYLFPIYATDLSNNEIYCEINYVVNAIEDYATAKGQKPFVMVGHVDTEVMNPIVANQFYLKIEKRKGRRNRETIYEGMRFDIINLRAAQIKGDSESCELYLNDDISHVLKQRQKYVASLQANGIKVCLSIKGGNTGLGFSNMTDGQIENFVIQVKTIVEMYDLDGVNLHDEGAGYGKEGTSAINAASFAKLIKAIKTAMPGKLLTLVDTRETTEALCDMIDGISVGNYIDYAWSSLEDHIAPYEPGYDYRPLSGVSEDRYGTLNLRDQSEWSQDELFAFEETPMFIDLFMEERFTPLSGTKVLVYDNIPFYDYHHEGMYWVLFYYQLLTMPGAEDGSYTYSWTASHTPCVERYFAFKKDW